MKGGFRWLWLCRLRTRNGENIHSRVCAFESSAQIVEVYTQHTDRCFWERTWVVFSGIGKQEKSALSGVFSISASYHYLESGWKNTVVKFVNHVAIGTRTSSTSQERCHQDSFHFCLCDLNVTETSSCLQHKLLESFCGDETFEQSENRTLLANTSEKKGSAQRSRCPVRHFSKNGVRSVQNPILKPNLNETR